MDPKKLVFVCFTFILTCQVALGMKKIENGVRLPVRMLKIHCAKDTDEFGIEGARAEFEIDGNEFRMSCPTGNKSCEFFWMEKGLHSKFEEKKEEEIKAILREAILIFNKSGKSKGVLLYNNKKFQWPEQKDEFK